MYNVLVWNMDFSTNIGTYYANCEHWIDLKHEIKISIHNFTQNCSLSTLV